MLHTTVASVTVRPQSLLMRSTAINPTPLLPKRPSCPGQRGAALLGTGQAPQRRSDCDRRDAGKVTGHGDAHPSCVRAAETDADFAHSSCPSRARDLARDGLLDHATIVARPGVQLEIEDWHLRTVLPAPKRLGRGAPRSGISQGSSTACSRSQRANSCASLRSAASAAVSRSCPTQVGSPPAWRSSSAVVHWPPCAAHQSALSRSC